MRKLNRLAALMGLPLFFVASQLWAQAPVVDVRSVSSPDYNQPAGGQGNLSELYYQMQLLKQEVMELRGIVEQQTHELEQLKKENLDRYIELDKRLSSGAVPAAPPVATDAAPTSPRAKPKPKATGITVREDPAPADGKADGKAASERQAYREAFELVKARQFEPALYAFENFLEQYPDGDLTPNAYYWAGELHLVSDPMDLTASRAAFSKLLAKYPNHPKVPDAMFKLGKVYFLQDEKGKSRHLLNQVIERYGNTDSTAPKLAAEFLKDNF